VLTLLAAILRNVIGDLILFRIKMDLIGSSKLAAFNISWHENPAKRIDSYVEPKGCLTKPEMANHTGDHSEMYEGFLQL